MSKFLAVDSLPSWFPLHHFDEPKLNYSTGVELVQWQKPSLWAFVAMTAFNPIFWNTVARNEFRNKTITKIVRSPLLGCYLLAISIFSLSGFRDHLYLGAVKDQPALAVLAHPGFKVLAAILFAAGQTFVISSMWALGVTGTYLGDYFGILMTHRVTSFPFNVLSDPMYVGSALSHLGTALWFQSPVGLALAAWVWIVYSIALKYEGPFTDKIYSGQHKKSDSPTPTTGTSSAPPATPSRRSGRIAAKSSHSDLDSDADVKPTTTPGRGPRKSGLAREAGVATPKRMTRSRSKGRVGSEDE
ncbi:hypothetical protein CI109_102751 [Kwoniella shandongensis]|uniref:Phosphatidyl-N-methylethanolamine N-methyltransferase n=1 Tax=Kwoniella shandongensis TaxID=1734106 RepID=A0A5M6BVD7_9TREE|nr:uncharacterized protein CI109_004926 [Kwoniella shandongensis]KAA5526723.1 hypothetical protein CI109_004926 [Kwoniella shandongensis]